MAIEQTSQPGPGAGRGESYAGSGVARLDASPGFAALLGQLKQTFAFRPGVGRSLLDFGYYASVLDLGTPQALAFSTDGIGTKAIVAQLMDRYDTVGIDCVAMNANDVLCVGAEPVAMLDYIACDVASDRLLQELGVGLLEGARRANISIPGGEISQIREIITGPRPGYAFDLVGTCVGLVGRDAVLTGERTEPGHAIVGLASSGIHSNGLTLARRVLSPQGADGLHEPVPELGGTLGDELLKPTAIYVKPVLAMLAAGLDISALCHITSDGFLNLSRVRAAVGFEIESLPAPPAIFELIQRRGPVEAAEMFSVYNMGVGFCVICAPGAVSRVIEHARAADFDAWELGRCVGDPRKRVHLRQHALTGEHGRFAPA